MLLFFRSPRALLTLGLLFLAAPSRAATPESSVVSISAATGTTTDAATDAATPPAFGGKGPTRPKPKPKPGPRGGDDDD